jgi:uncharacterized protein YhaN
LLDLASNGIEAAELAAAERREVDRALEELDVELAAKRSESREHARSHDRLEKEWREALEPLGIDSVSGPDEALLTIDLLAEAFQKIDRIAERRRRTAGIERDARAFAHDVERLAEEHAPDLGARPAADAAAALLDRHRRGQEAAVERRAIDKQLVETSRWLARQRARQTEAATRLQDLVRLAGVEEAASLESAERRSDEARELDRTIASIEKDLLAEGISPRALPDELSGLDADTAAARLEDVERRLDELREEQSVIDQRIGGGELGRRKLEDPRAEAAEAALDADAALSTVRELAERYTRLKIAHVVLAREIERYRQKNQGPILSRASDLFARLTLGSFAGLKTDYDDDDQPILLGVRADGRQTGVEAMSDGTRDQLYLALYLATLERFAKQGDPMPLIVDDVLIHFDDDRARAALEVLGELSKHTQVLFFTHHARLVELAREAIPHTRLFIRDLSETGSAPAPMIEAPS